MQIFSLHWIMKTLGFHRSTLKSLIVLHHPVQAKNLYFNPLANSDSLYKRVKLISPV